MFSELVSFWYIQPLQTRCLAKTTYSSANLSFRSFVEHAQHRVQRSSKLDNLETSQPNTTLRWLLSMPNTVS